MSEMTNCDMCGSKIENGNCSCGTMIYKGINPFNNPAVLITNYEFLDKIEQATEGTKDG
jgi:hypothetical protein